MSTTRYCGINRILPYSSWNYQKYCHCLILYLSVRYDGRCNLFVDDYCSDLPRRVRIGMICIVSPKISHGFGTNDTYTLKFEVSFWILLCLKVCHVVFVFVLNADGDCVPCHQHTPPSRLTWLYVSFFDD